MEDVGILLLKHAAQIFNVSFDDLKTKSNKQEIVQCKNAIRYYLKNKHFNKEFIAKSINPHIDRTTLYNSFESFINDLHNDNELLIKFIEFSAKADRILIKDNHCENIRREAVIRLMRMKQMQIVRILKSHMGEPISSKLIDKISMYDVN
jgi:hypothetical protein